jgi:hypothetical protein
MGTHRRSSPGRIGVALFAVCGLLFVSAVAAQSVKSAKRAESLEKAGEKAEAAVQDVVQHLKGMLEGYNAIMDGSAKNLQSSYKKLVNDVKSTEKKIGSAKKQTAALGKEADKFFLAWEKDLESISSDNLRDKSATRLEDTKTRYAAIVDTLGRASAEFAPVLQNLNDQILVLGRDLSTDGIADLQDEAAELNRQVDEVSSKVKQLLSGAADTDIDTDEES